MGLTGHSASLERARIVHIPPNPGKNKGLGMTTGQASTVVVVNPVLENVTSAAKSKRRRFMGRNIAKM